MQDNNIRMHERMSAVEIHYKHLDERLDCIEHKLDKVRDQIAQWKGSFSLIATLGGLLGGGIVSIIVWLIAR